MSYAAFNPDVITQRAEAVVAKADCRAVDQAIVGYLIDNDGMPRKIEQLQRYVRGDISDYRIVNGVAEGPGCDY